MTVRPRPPNLSSPVVCVECKNACFPLFFLNLFCHSILPFTYGAASLGWDVRLGIKLGKPTTPGTLQNPEEGVGVMS